MLKENSYLRKGANLLLALLLVCLLAPLSIPAGMVSITLQTFVLFLATAILGKKQGALIAILYLAAGAAGLPVFSGFSSGIEKLYGTTAGFLWAFPFMCYLLGWLIEQYPARYSIYIFHFILVHLALLIIGFLVLMAITESPHFPFDNLLKLMPGLFIKSILGGVLAMQFRPMVNRAGVRV